MRLLRQHESPLADGLALRPLVKLVLVAFGLAVGVTTLVHDAADCTRRTRSIAS